LQALINICYEVQTDGVQTRILVPSYSMYKAKKGSVAKLLYWIRHSHYWHQLRLSTQFDPLHQRKEPLLHSQFIVFLTQFSLPNGKEETSSPTPHPTITASSV
jgi:hypothetical protein